MITDAQRTACPLTRAELRVLELLMEGRTYEAIADELGRSPSTIRSQLHSAHRRLDVTTSYQAVLKCVRAGWLCWDEFDPATMVLRRIESLLQDLVQLANQQLRGDSVPLTESQRRYLETFDACLCARTPEQARRAAIQRDHALARLLEDAGLIAHGGAQPLMVELGHAVDREVDAVTRWAA